MYCIFKKRFLNYFKKYFLKKNHFFQLGIFKKTELKISQKGFTQSVLTLMTGTFVGQLLTLASSPILTRLYSPEEFGMFALMTVFSATFSTIASGRYELAIMLPKQDDDSINITALCCLLALLVSLSLLIAICLFSKAISLALGSPDFETWLYIVPGQVFFASLYQAFNYWSNRKKQYKRLSISRIFQAFSIALISIFLGLMGARFSGLMLGYLFGQIVSTTLLGLQIYREEKSLLKMISKQKILQQSIRYINFPKHLTLSHLIGVIHGQLPFIFISRFFGAEVLGSFSLANRFVSLPSSLIATSIGEVFRREATEIYNREGRFDDILQKTVKRTSLMALPIHLGVIIFSPYLFKFFFGSEWRQAGDLAAIIAVASLFSFAITPIDKGAVIVGATRYIFCWHLSNLLFNTGLGLFFNTIGSGINLFMWCLVCIRVFHYIVDYFIEYSFSKQSAKTF
jgi:O-antigen/teichoic acid export membrane protein